MKTYAVDDLLRLQSDLREHYSVRRDVLREWYAHWETQGNGSQLIAVLEQKLLSENCRDDDLAGLLDLAFATKLRLEGAAAAFPYIVQAQLFNGGWAMQELAALLLSPETQEEVEKQLMMELARCRLEAETVEVICVFWMGARQG
ncbi:hypothetical protein LGM85_14420 [Burkholderia multivorans]|uniref:Uncharacterized protein n=1 Tax=Burkholderia multivorans TaxID=87883 RepID=A0AAP2HIN4_9BURK|nr:hypothetical protein [Burkholderia multivorans]MBU9357050.1 hypothetical protein [Burkholderia multivorans]MBU9361591.1 hypothetical protein [Burkholderia multivorans]MBU9596660.1 hypothetical protein [Burkholderia multivorans]MCA8485129.1 hypothetical protein [Burkholderia multivorans]